MGEKWARWTSEQLDYLSRYYGRMPRAKLKAALDERGPPHSLTAIKSMTSRKKIMRKAPKGYINLVDVHPITQSDGRQSAHYMCRKQAQRDGVAIREYESNNAPLMAPEWWVEEYLREYRKREDLRATARREGWWSSKRIAIELGLPPERGCDYSLGRRGPDWWRDGMLAAPKVKMGACGLLWYVSNAHVKPLLTRWRAEKAN